jgi:hypothetical protein
VELACGFKLIANIPANGKQSAVDEKIYRNRPEQ